MKSDDESLFIVVFALIVTPLSIMLAGLTGMLLWKWIVVPTFTVSALTFAQACGLYVLARFCTFNLRQTNDDGLVDLIKRTLSHWIGALMFMFIGFVVSIFI